MASLLFVSFNFGLVDTTENNVSEASVEVKNQGLEVTPIKDASGEYSIVTGDGKVIKELELSAGQTIDLTGEVQNGNLNKGDTVSLIKGDDKDRKRVKSWEVGPSDGSSGSSGSSDNPQMTVDIVNLDSTVQEQNKMRVTYEVVNEGDRGTDTVTVSIAGKSQSKEVELGWMKKETYEFEWTPELGDGPETYDLVVESSTSTESREVRVTMPPLRPIHSPPNDLNGDGLYEDTNGEAGFNIVDVSAFYTAIGNNNPVVYEHVEQFDFNGDDKITVEDANELYKEI